MGVLISVKITESSTSIRYQNNQNGQLTDESFDAPLRKFDPDEEFRYSSLLESTVNSGIS